MGQTFWPVPFFVRFERKGHWWRLRSALNHIDADYAYLSTQELYWVAVPILWGGRSGRLPSPRWSQSYSVSLGAPAWLQVEAPL